MLGSYGKAVAVIQAAEAIDLACQQNRGYSEILGDTNSGWTKSLKALVQNDPCTE